MDEEPSKIEHRWGLPLYKGTAPERFLFAVALFLTFKASADQICRTAPLAALVASMA